MNTRTLAMVAVVLAVGTAGCGFLFGDEPATFTATPATVEEDAYGQTGYQETNVSERNVTRQFELADQTREVVVVNQLAMYERQVSLPVLQGSERAAVFTVFASPKVELAGQTFNPLDDYDERDILQQFQSQYEEVSVGDKVGSSQVDALGETRNVSKFEGTARLAGQNVDVYIHASKFEHDGDFIAVVAIYPQRLSGEEGKVKTLINGIEHEG
jgi:hypothetical protein